MNFKSIFFRQATKTSCLLGNDSLQQKKPVQTDQATLCAFTAHNHPN